MGLKAQIIDHILIGGHSGVFGCVFLVLLVVSGGVSRGQLKLGVDFDILLLTSAAAALLGNAVYAINSYYDREVDRINKPLRPVPSGRLTPEHALRYAACLFILGWLVSLTSSIMTGNYLIVILWTAFSLLGLAYSVPPLKLKARHILGNLCFAAFAALALTISCVAFGVSAPTLIELVMFLIVVTGLVTLKDFHDYDGDKSEGDITLPVKFGRRKAAAISIALMGFPLVLKLAKDVVSRASLWWMIREGTWLYLLYICVFGVYATLDYYKGSSVSSIYSVTQYYFLISLTTYFLIRVPLFGFAPRAYDGEILLSYLLCALISFVSLHKGHIIKPG